MNQARFATSFGGSCGVFVVFIGFHVRFHRLF